MAETPNPSQVANGANSSSASSAPGLSAGNEWALSDVTGQSALVGPEGRALFGPTELAIVLSHYDLGVISKVHPFNRGSRKAPKAVLETDKGAFLLKRRARGREDPYKVALAHTLQLHLVARQFPLPHLVGTRPENNSMLQLFGCIYEVFEYIQGQPYDCDLNSTQDAGRVLGLFHKLLLDFQSQYTPGAGNYHNSDQVKAALLKAPANINKSEVDAEEAAATLQFLNQSYLHAAEAAEAVGLSQWPMQIVHADWHPGNMLFHDGKVVAVIDYDTCRMGQRVTDVANGALQFSMVGQGPPSEWPDYLDTARVKRFIRGYESVQQISEAEIEAIPHLMIQALIAEAVLPIAATGLIGRLKGYPFLLTVCRKVKWLQKNEQDIKDVIG
jgi:homoserine kinase type II